MEVNPGDISQYRQKEIIKKLIIHIFPFLRNLHAGLFSLSIYMALSGNQEKKKITLGRILES